ncbi:hypothetical protein SteCoe_37418 [Stentor coeruleus]|uniref:HIT domain-containing protein n=1 Tax=Stentor coeruleus TaxID=5963 RepID=A0A1R2AN11_9CILI|nr:hypothetical protein SteCoe_37418 [Stentor coeruleus]
MSKNPSTSTYDHPGTIASIPELCIFCKIITEKEGLIYEDEDVYVLNDKFPVSQVHLLVIPKRHIKNSYHLRNTDKDLVQKMIEVGSKIARDMNLENYRLGFHRALVISVPHLHMHVISLPFTSIIKQKLLFNWFLFTDAQNILNSLL